MFLKDKKFKYRIVTNNDSTWPYVVEHKRFIFWFNKSRHNSYGGAEQEVRNLARQEIMGVGKVLFEYNEKDFLVDKLKGVYGSIDD